MRSIRFSFYRLIYNEFIYLVLLGFHVCKVLLVRLMGVCHQTNKDDTSFSTFFSETGAGRHVPRAVMVDLEPTVWYFRFSGVKGMENVHLGLSHKLNILIRELLNIVSGELNSCKFTFAIPCLSLAFILQDYEEVGIDSVEGDGGEDGDEY
uniref:Tubulin domain-containing protein n=1 Tax=Heterorhabditis bacteriophora TaxID=37862 RepID=A0A1I7WHK9_HETBA